MILHAGQRPDANSVCGRFPAFLPVVDFPYLAVVAIEGYVNEIAEMFQRDSDIFLLLENIRDTPKIVGSVPRVFLRGCPHNDIKADRTKQRLEAGPVHRYRRFAKQLQNARGMGMLLTEHG
jgi:hypothetical protein